MTLKRHQAIQGYEGPTGAYVATSGRIIPLTDPGAHIALTDAAVLTSLGVSPKAEEYSEIAKNHGAVRPAS